jgi:hypothetical protein
MKYYSKGNYLCGLNHRLSIWSLSLKGFLIELDKPEDESAKNINISL